MIYLLFSLIAFLSVSFVTFFSARKGVVDFGEKIKIYKPCEEEITPYKGGKLVLITIICFVVSAAIQISLYKNTSIINFIKLYGLFLIVFTAGVVDSKRKIIPNFLIIIGLIFRAVLYLYEIFFVENLRDILVNDLIGFAIGFVFLAVVSLISKGALGFGDAKLFGIIGITSGSFCTYSTLLLGLVISTVVSVVNMVRKKMDCKASFPFGPCIAIGYIVALLLTSY